MEKSAVRMRFRFSSLILLVAFLSTATLSLADADAPSATVDVRITVTAADLEPRDDIFYMIAKRALDVAEFKANWVPVSEPMQLPQERMLREVADGRGADITWTMTSSARESRLLPVRIPLLRGLSGYRVLVVRREDTDRFESIHTLEALSAMVGGQAQDWPDIDILRANGLEQISATSMEQLYNQLRAGRIDYFPRSIAEVEVEKNLTDFSQLKILRSPVLRYPAPFYYFVSPKKPWLADAMHDGLTTLHESGELQAMLERHPNAGAWFSDPKRWQGRTIIDLDNPYLHPETPLCEASLWWQVGETPWPDCNKTAPTQSATAGI